MVGSNFQAGNRRREVPVRLVRFALTIAISVPLVLAFASAVLGQDLISFGGKDEVNVSIKDGLGKATVVVVNAGDAATIDWTVQLAPDKVGNARTAKVDPAQSSLDGRKPNTITLTFKDISTTGKLDGVLVGTPPGTGTPITKSLTISNFGLSWPIDPSLIIVQVLVVSLVLLTARYFTINHDFFTGPLANPKWSYATTWTASFAGAGALLATLVASGALPDEPYLLGKADFAALAIIFGALGVLAPVLFAALNGSVGSIEVFHVCTWVSTAAVIGQLTTIVLLLIDATGQGSSDWFVVFLGAIQAVGLVAICICWPRVATRSTIGARPQIGHEVWFRLSSAKLSRLSVSWRESLLTRRSHCFRGMPL
jgi:hypothetical protein